MIFKNFVPSFESNLVHLEVVENSPIFVRIYSESIKSSVVSAITENPELQLKENVWTSETLGYLHDN